MGTKDQKADVIRLKIPSNPKYIGMVRAMVEDLAKKNGFAKNKIEELKLAINEALANVIEHAYQWQKNRVIFIYFSIHYQDIEVVIKDFGKKLDVNGLKSRNLDEVKDSGLGVFLIKNMVDKVEYHSEDTGTELKLVKNKT